MISCLRCLTTLSRSVGKIDGSIWGLNVDEGRSTTAINLRIKEANRELQEAYNGFIDANSHNHEVKNAGV